MVAVLADASLVLNATAATEPETPTSSKEFTESSNDVEITHSRVEIINDAKS